MYLDNAATSFPKPRRVTEAVFRCIREYCGNPGRGSHSMSVAAAAKLYECRGLLGDMFGADGERISFTLNTTYALNMVIKGAVKKDDHVLISDMEHNSVLRPVDKLARDGLISYNIFRTRGLDDKSIVKGIESAVKDSTSMLICTHVPNITNKPMPIEAIGKMCHRRGIYFVVDGAQGAGRYPIDVSKMCIDALCIPGHKSLYGVQGIGAIIFGSSDSVIDTIIEGGSGTSSLEREMPVYLPDRFEAGTMNTPAAAGWCEGLRWVRSLGEGAAHHAECAAWEAATAFMWDDKRFRLYDETPGSVVLFNMRGADSSDVAAALDSRGVCVRSGLHCAPLAHDTIGTGGGAVRVSFGAMSTKRDGFRFWRILSDIADEIL